MQLLDKVKYDDASDHLYALGDLIDRGPASNEVVRWIREAMERPRSLVHCVMGNHDDKHARYFKHLLKKREHSNYKIPINNFNSDKLRTFNSMDDEDLKFLGNLPSLLEVFTTYGTWIVVHAGLQPGKGLWEQEKDKIRHIRFVDPETKKVVILDENLQPPPGSVYWTDLYEGKEHVVYGHFVHSLHTPKVTVRPNQAQLVGLDTGCCFGGHLTCFILPQTNEPITPDHFVQVKAERAYSGSLIKDYKI